MLQTLKFAAAMVLGGLICWLHRRLKGRPDPKAALVIEPAPGSRGNLGDEALLCGMAQLLTSAGMRRICLATFASESPWPHLAEYGEQIPIGRRLRVLRFLWLARQFGCLYYLGADNLDGYYRAEFPGHVLSLLSALSSAEQRTTVVGFSFNEAPHPRAVAAWKRCSKRLRLCARDPVSAARFEREIGRSVVQTADVALHMPPDPGGPAARSVLDWLERQRASHPLLIGVNFAATRAGASAKQIAAAELIEQGRFVVESLLQRHPCVIVLMPHVFHRKANDHHLAQAIRDGIRRDLVDRVNILPEETRSREVKAICQGIDFVVTGRMHLAIAALGVGTPVAALSYQGKFEGLMELFGLQGVTLSPQDASDGQAILSFVETQLSRRDELRRQIGSRRDAVLEMARENL